MENIENFKHSQLTKEIIAAYFQVYNELGYGFLEKVYVNSLLIELRKKEYKCFTNNQINVFYDNQLVGFYIPDIIVNNLVVIEVKATESLCKEHTCQLINYLKATEIEVGLLLNFGKVAEFQRKVFSNYNNQHKS